MKQRIIIKVVAKDARARRKAISIICSVPGVTSAEAMQGADFNNIVIIGNGIDLINLTRKLRRKIGHAEVVSTTPEGYVSRPYMPPPLVMPPPPPGPPLLPPPGPPLVITPNSLPIMLPPPAPTSPFILLETTSPCAPPTHPWLSATPPPRPMVPLPYPAPYNNGELYQYHSNVPSTYIYGYGNHAYSYDYGYGNHDICTTM